MVQLNDFMVKRMENWFFVLITTKKGRTHKYINFPPKFWHLYKLRDYRTC